ncbi:unnamed protein product, partial [Ectocarpus sp. 4 AP-2014]
MQAFSEKRFLSVRWLQKAPPLLRLPASGAPFLPTKQENIPLLKPSFLLFSPNDSMPSNIWPPSNSPISTWRVFTSRSDMDISNRTLVSFLVTSGVWSENMC